MLLRSVATSFKEIAMKMNRIQFQPGLSLNKFLDQYGDQEQCESGNWICSPARRVQVPQDVVAALTAVTGEAGGLRFSSAVIV